MKNKFLLLLWVLFVFTHLLNIYSIPIFEDEGEYLLLSEAIIKNPINNLFIYSINGIFPLYGWLVSLLSVFIQDTLFSGRLLNILLSSSLVLWIRLEAKLHKLPSRFEWIAQFLLLTSPIILLNSRVGLLDTSILVFTAWYIYFTEFYIQTHVKKAELGIGIFFLAALLTKATGIFGMPSSALIIFRALKLPEKRRVVINSITIFIISFLASYVYFSYFGKQIKSDSGASVTAFTSFPEFIVAFKLRTLVTWLWFKAYYLPYFLIPVMFFIKKLKIKYSVLYIPMLAWILTSLLIMISLNKFYFPRHILVVSLPLIIIFSGLVIRFNRIFMAIFVFFALVFQSILFYRILVNPQQAELALEDRFEYFENYTSGSRILDISKFLTTQANGQNTIVWLDGSYAIEYGLRRNLPKNIEIKSFRLDENYSGVELKEVVKDIRKGFVVVNRWKPKNIDGLKLIKEFPVSFRHTQFVYEIP